MVLCFFKQQIDILHSSDCLLQFNFTVQAPTKYPCEMNPEYPEKYSEYNKIKTFIFLLYESF